MTFDEYQTQANKTSGNNSIQAAALGLCGESGEVADLIKKYVYHSHPFPMRKIMEELGDILWYIAEMCSVLGVSLETIAEENIYKLSARYPEGFSSNRSINREGEGK
jgi:NTP pyrophosphatase (non-canonical NTP hydrolase)